jgi:hypothetical protein
MRDWLAFALLAAIAYPRAATADTRINDADNNSALLPSGFTQSETALVKHGQTVCVAWNDKAVSGIAAGWGASSSGGSSFTDAGPFPTSNPQGGGTDPSIVRPGHAPSRGRGRCRRW